MPSSLFSLSTISLFVAAYGQTLPFRDDMSNIASSSYWTDFGSVTQSDVQCVGSSPCVQLYGYAELYFLHFSLAEHSTISIGFNLCFDCDSTSTAAATEHFNVYYSCGASQFVAPDWAVLKQYDGTLASGTLFEAERLSLPTACDNAADLNLAFISFTASSSMFVDSLIITTPTSAPSTSPSTIPSRTPSKAPSRSPTNLPSMTPSASPTLPTASPTAPTSSPTAVTLSPSLSPSRSPSKAPSKTPSRSPSAAPTTSMPTSIPSESPSFSPSFSPLATPTKSPSRSPSTSPTEPTLSPSAATPSPTEVTSSPTAVTRSPSYSPTTSAPTAQPTEPTHSPITYIEHLRLIAEQYNPTATSEPTMAPSVVNSGGGEHQTTRTPSSAPTPTPKVTERPTAAESVLVNGTHSALQQGNASTTPSPILIQYVFIREPTAAPTNGAAGRYIGGSPWWMVVALAVVCTLF